MELIIVTVVSIMTLCVLAATRNYLIYIKLRFRMFALRDDVLTLALAGIVPDEIAIKYYNALNWPLNYLKAYPVFFCFTSLAQAMDLIEEPVVDLNALPAELKDWYSRFGDLTVDLIKAYTPFARLYSNKPISEHLMLFLTIILFLRMIFYKKHPMGRAYFAGVSFKKAKEETRAITESRESARQFSSLALTH